MADSCRCLFDVARYCRLVDLHASFIPSFNYVEVMKSAVFLSASPFLEVKSMYQTVTAPLITFVVPAYNAVSTLEAAVRSLSEQTSDDWGGHHRR